MALAASVAFLGSASSARAHISLVSHTARHGSAQKDAPCGVLGGTRSENVYPYAPGETIEIVVSEYVPHPGYFRIAFDDDGTDDFLDPRWIVPVEGYNRPGGCPMTRLFSSEPDPLDQCRPTGEGDFCNTDAVLLDNLAPHISSTGEYTFRVTLPDIECDNCTLQIVQVMMDPHGPYNIDRNADPNYFEDNYHQCIDIELSRSATPASTDNSQSAGIDCRTQVQPTDAGVMSGGDAGTMTPTSTTDAAVVIGDAGAVTGPTTALDGGSPSSGAVDSGTTRRPTTPSSGGSSGCQAAPGDSAGVFPMLLAALGLLAFRRKRTA